VPWLVDAFMLVLVMGGSLGSLALAALVLDGVQVLVSSYGNPVVCGLTSVVLAVIILRVGPSPSDSGGHRLGLLERPAQLRAPPHWRGADDVHDPSVAVPLAPDHCTPER
jgi:hypothetical protein